MGWQHQLALRWATVGDDRVVERSWLEVSLDHDLRISGVDRRIEGGSRLVASLSVPQLAEGPLQDQLLFDLLVLGREVAVGGPIERLGALILREDLLALALLWMSTSWRKLSFAVRV